MKKDSFGQIILSEKDLLDHYYTNPKSILKNALVEKQIVFDESLGIENIPKLIEYTIDQSSIEEFDKRLQSEWMMPKKYMNMDIALWVLEQCHTDAELQRAGEELFLFQERNMFTLLKYLKYLVDTMRANNIVWGVGRGSSVSSFVLFLIGVHKINSLYYDLSINEFLK